MIASKDALAMDLSAFIVPLIALLYFISNNKKTLFFSLFLMFYASTELLFFFRLLLSDNAYYFVGMVLGILAYLFLFIEFAKTFDFKNLLKRFKMQVVILSFLSLYTCYFLFDFMASTFVLTIDYFLENLYNSLLFASLSLVFLNYIHKENKKSWFLFLGTMSLVFSEIAFVAYLFLIEENAFDFMFVVLMALAFYFFVKQAKYNDDAVNQKSMTKT